jgi:hypothetical protein
MLIKRPNSTYPLPLGGYALFRVNHPSDLGWKYSKLGGSFLHFKSFSIDKDGVRLASVRYWRLEMKGARYGN